MIIDPGSFKIEESALHDRSALFSWSRQWLSAPVMAINAVNCMRIKTFDIQP